MRVGAVSLIPLRDVETAIRSDRRSVRNRVRDEVLRLQALGNFIAAGTMPLPLPVCSMRPPDSLGPSPITMPRSAPRICTTFSIVPLARRDPSTSSGWIDSGLPPTSVIATMTPRWTFRCWSALAVRSIASSI